MRIKKYYPTGKHALKDTEVETHAEIITIECDVTLGHKDAFKSYVHKEECNTNWNLETIRIEVSIEMLSFSIKDSKELYSSILR